MLTATRAAFTAILTAAIAITAPLPSALADHEVVCDERGRCTARAHDPGDPGGGGGGGGGGGAAECRNDMGMILDCYDPQYGWWNNEDDCYYKLLSPQPPEGDPDWEGHEPGDGAVYDITCIDGSSGGTWGGNRWRATPPPGYRLPSPAVLAVEALKTLQVPSPEPRYNPSPRAVVGLGTWLWVDPAQSRPLSARAVAGPVWSEVTVTPASTRWDPGDGHEAIRCAGPGTPYPAESTDCAYTYDRSSAGLPKARSGDPSYTAWVSMTWAVTWRGSGGTSGTLPAITRTTSFPVAVMERQTVVTDSRG
jgi:hypothetical protein